MTHSVSFNVQGRPQFNRHLRLASVSQFQRQHSQRLGDQDKIYASVNRRFTTIAGLDSRWEDNAAVGFAKAIRRLTLTTDAGYLRGDAITTVVPAYHGYFVAPRARYKLMNAMGARGLSSVHGAGGNLVTGNLSYAVVGIESYPAPLHFR